MAVTDTVVTTTDNAYDREDRAKLLKLLDRARENRGLQPPTKPPVSPLATHAHAVLTQSADHVGPAIRNPTTVKTEQQSASASPSTTSTYEAPPNIHECTYNHTITLHTTSSESSPPEMKDLNIVGPAGSFSSFTPLAEHSTNISHAPSSLTCYQEESFNPSKKNEIMQSVTTNLQSILSPTTVPSVNHRDTDVNLHTEPSQNHGAITRLCLHDQPVSPRRASLDFSKLTPDEYEDFELHSDFLHMVHILIPANAVGCLIGKGGDYIRDINKQTECTLSIRDQNLFPFKDDRVLRIYGKPKGICLAQRLVIERIRAHRAEKRDPNYVQLTGDFLVPLPDTSVTKAMAAALAPADDKQFETVTITDDTLNWLVQREDVGKIMGTKGKILLAIARDSGTIIHVSSTDEMPPGSTERIVTIKGTPENIETALKIVVSKVGGRPEPNGFNGKLGQYYAIPYRSAGFLIGHEGTRIREVSERTGARLQIAAQQDLPLGCINRTIHIRGNKKQVEHAYRIVCAKLRDYLTTPDDVPVDEDVDEISVKLVLPIRICSYLLDQRGVLIKEIAEKSGAHTRFLAPQDDETRICVFTGEMNRVFRAQRLVLQVVAGDLITSKYLGAHGVPRKRKRLAEEEGESETHDIKRLSKPSPIVSSRPKNRSTTTRSSAPRAKQEDATSGRKVQMISATAPARIGGNRGSTNNRKGSSVNVRKKPNAKTTKRLR